MIEALRAAVAPGPGPAPAEPIVVASGTQAPQGEGEQVCPICIEAVTGEGHRWPGGCAHRFHERCLAQMLAHGTDYCPLCRIGLDGHPPRAACPHGHWDDCPFGCGIVCPHRRWTGLVACQACGRDRPDPATPSRSPRPPPDEDEDDDCEPPDGEATPGAGPPRRRMGVGRG